LACVRELTCLLVVSVVRTAFALRPILAFVTKAEHHWNRPITNYWRRIGGTSFSREVHSCGLRCEAGGAVHGTFTYFFSIEIFSRNPQPDRDI
jgi:hypothetical protein